MLGAVLLDNTALESASAAGLRPEHFLEEHHREIYGAMLSLRARGEEIDPITLLFEMRARTRSDFTWGGLPYLQELFDPVLSARAAGAHAALIVEKARRRRYEALGQAVREAASGPLSGDSLRNRMDVLARDLQHLTSPQQTAPRIPVEWASELSDELQVPRQIVEGVLLAGGMSMMFGESNSGKSYLAIHLAICVSLGEAWLGRRTHRMAVLYVAAEGAFSIRVRLLANRKHYGRAIGAFGLIPCALSLVEPSGDVEDLIDLVRVKAVELGEPIGLIVVDTVARVMGGGDENAAQDMGRLVSAGDRIREATGAHLLYIHHAGKDASRGARGHSSLRAALDTEIEVTADAGTKTHTAKITKQRDLASNGAQLAGRFVPVELGVDQWGGAITACAVVDTESVATANKPRSLTASQQAVLGYLAGRDAGVRRAVIVEALTPQGMARQSVYRAINDLLASGLVVFTAGLIYAVKG